MLISIPNESAYCFSKHLCISSRLIPPPYDINRDGKVDILDVATIAIAFGSYPGYPNWNPVADLSNDGKVDILDIAMVAVHYGEYFW